MIRPALILMLAAVASACSPQARNREDVREGRHLFLALLRLGR